MENRGQVEVAGIDRHRKMGTRSFKEVSHGPTQNLYPRVQTRSREAVEKGDILLFSDGVNPTFFVRNFTITQLLTMFSFHTI